MDDFADTLRRAQRGDPAAVAALYERHRRAVESAARRGLGRDLRAHVQAEDVSQSVFGDMLRELPRFADRGEESFRAWLLAKTRNKLRAKARRTSRRGGRARVERLVTEVGEGLRSRGVQPHETAERREDASRLSRLLGALDPEQREVLGLVADEDLSWAEVAQRLRLPGADAARMRYVRALAVLRERWTRS